MEKSTKELVLELVKQMLDTDYEDFTSYNMYGDEITDDTYQALNNYYDLANNIINLLKNKA